ncbi:hypothetical protein CVS40_11807 [Lucilia cuprina]|nr:hypothetical protein CVS40_11807 [Lucilia cuprina]
MATNNNDSNFIDMSSTINVAGTARNVSGQSQGVEEEATGNTVGIDPVMRELVVDETLSVQRALEDRMKKMIQDEMKDIRKVVGELSSAVKDLADTRQVPNANRSNVSNSFTFPTTRPLNISGNISRHPSIFEIIIKILPNNGANTGLQFPQEPIAVSSATPNIRNGNTPVMTQNEAAGYGSTCTAEKTVIRVDKWGLIFVGNNTHLSVEDFIFRLEHLQADYNVLCDESSEIFTC